MRDDAASLTAIGAAGHRAAHQVIEGGSLFRDPVIRPLLGPALCAEADARAADPARRTMRLFMALRSRAAEDAIATAVANGCRQVVVLGAGYDTFGLRNPYADKGLRVFELDVAATQAAKRRRMAETGFDEPDLLTFVSIDFERDDLGLTLARAGVEGDEPVFFVWLGVVPYLTAEAIDAVLSTVGRYSGAIIAFDYGEPIEAFSGERRRHIEALTAKVASQGEPFRSLFRPDEIPLLLARSGLHLVEDLGIGEMLARYAGRPPTGEGRAPGPHVVLAKVSA